MLLTKELLLKENINPDKEGILEIPNRYTALDKELFKDRRDIKDFKNCFNLKKIELPNFLKEIEKGAFYNCNNLQEITGNATLIKFVPITYESYSFLNNLVIYFKE